jgi:hypothetical protein
VAESIFTTTTRCKVCKAFWMYPCLHAGAEDVKPLCPCGGELEMYDIEAEIKKLPYVPYDPPKKAP